MQLLNITTCCVTASALWVGIVQPLHNYALCYGAAHRTDGSSERGAWPFISLGLGDIRMQ